MNANDKARNGDSPEKTGESAKTRLAKTYEPAAVEARLYGEWESKGYFRAGVCKSKKPFSIVIPPPNITGQLHLGHALDNAMQDVLIRWRRMQGYSALWMPGTDHASIATEAKLVEALADEGKTKADIGRDEFLRRAWAWKEEYAGRIVGQLKRMGCSCDWERERFTLDEGLSDAVIEVFVRLYDDGLIYRGERIINWCPKCRTTISDIEVDYREREGHLWSIRYPVVDPKEGEPAWITVATTRPETMFGDAAVAVNPSDSRYASLVGKNVRLPLTKYVIPIIADEYVDMEFGTGAVKITPAHDPNDFEVGQRHGLKLRRVMDDGAVMNDNAGAYGGLTREKARAKAIEDLSALGLLEETKSHAHNVGECSRCGTLVEPIASRQWFVSMKPLAEPAVEAVKNGRTQFVPDRFAKIYYNWMENVQDWCVSRQLWWGHRIPAYYCDECGELIVSKTAPDKCKKCGSVNLRQDEDSLDTWFSSALWPFSTMGWPKDTPEYKYFYPTNVLVTGYDIIFFWVARMIFSGLRHTGAEPFRHVLIHGLVRDEQGRKMSKSLGNGVDPMDIIDQYGADALRFALLIGNAAGNDLRFSKEKQEQARNFANKIWNAARFVLMHEDADETENALVSLKELINAPLSSADRWILSAYSRLVADVTENLEKFELGIALQKIYDFVWDSYCDWYIEFAKTAISASFASSESSARADAGNAADKKATTVSVLRYVFSGCMKLLHPFMPFITDEVYKAINGTLDSAMVSQWPTPQKELESQEAESRARFVMDVIRGVRNLRAERDVPPSRKLTARFATSDVDKADALMDALPYIERLAGISSCDVQVNLGVAAGEVSANRPSVALNSDSSKDTSASMNALAAMGGGAETKDSSKDSVSGVGYATFVVDGAQAFVPLGELIDVARESERLEKERVRLVKEIERASSRLSGAGFLAKAPPAIVADEREKLSKYQIMLEKVCAEKDRLASGRSL